MMLFKFPSIQIGSHRVMLWGIEKTWSQLGRWDHAPILWNFEKALQESSIDRKSTRLHPIHSKSAFSAEIFSSLKKATSTLKKLHSRKVELFVIARLKGEGNSHFLEGLCPPWIKLLQVTKESNSVSLIPIKQNEWFSISLMTSSSIYVVRTDIIECTHQLELIESGACRYEALSEWLTTPNPISLGFFTEDLDQ